MVGVTEVRRAKEQWTRLPTSYSGAAWRHPAWGENLKHILSQGQGARDQEQGGKESSEKATESQKEACNVRGLLEGGTEAEKTACGC